MAQIRLQCVIADTERLTGPPFILVTAFEY